MYSWNSNRLILDLTFYLHKDVTKEKSLLMCSNIIKLVKEDSSIYIPVAFFHNGYSTKGKSNIENFSKNITDRLVYRVKIRKVKKVKKSEAARYLNGMTYYEAASCESMPNEDKVYFIEPYNL